MKLPEIEESAVQESSSSIGLVNASLQNFAGTVQKGLTAFGQELVKSQNNKAAADLLTGLESTALDLRSKKTFTTQELRDTLGPAYDSLPPEIKSQTTKTTLDASTGESVTTDREDIPTFAVAGHIFDAKAKALLSNASANFTSPGWAAEFQERAQHEILQKKMQLSEHQLKDAHDYMLQQDTTTAVDLANAGRFGEAKAVIDGSRTMDLSHKVQLQSHVDKIQQVRPLYESLRTGDIGTMAQQLVALGDPKQFTKLSEDERLSFTNRMESEIKQFQAKLKSSADEQLKANSDAGWNGIFTKERQGQPVSYADIPMPGTVHAEQQKAMIEYVDKLNKGEKPETDWTLYAGLLDTSKDRAKFTNVDLLKYRNRLADTEFKQLLDIQMGLKGGNPEAYDHFQTTDEAINTQLAGAPYKLDVHDKDKAELLGYVKTQVQKALAREQESNNGKPLSLDDRDRVIGETLRANVDPRQHRFLIPDVPTSVPAHEAGVPALVATTFRRAAVALDPAGMKKDAKKTLTAQYQDYTFYEPMIERAWQVQKGKNVAPDDAVRSWYYLKQNWTRLEGVLRSSGGWTDNEALRKERLSNLAVSEVLRQLGR